MRGRQRELAESSVRRLAADLARDVRRLERTQGHFNQAIAEARGSGLNEKQIVRLMEQGVTIQADRDALTRYLGQAVPVAEDSAIPAGESV